MTPAQYRAAATQLGRSIAGAQTGIHLELGVKAAASQKYANGQLVIPDHRAALIAYWLKTGTPPSEALKEQQL